ncbi:MAG: DUF4430 domain-containing protein [Clostridia bacterium]|nr:DUF4430 domain-containing protein [Clostridia bacterium]
MKRKPVEVLSLILVLISIITAFAPGAFSTRACAVSGESVEAEIKNILRGELNANGNSAVQELIDGVYSDNAGSTTDWFVFSLIQYAGGKYDYSKFALALKNRGVSSSPTTKERYALTFAAMGANSAYVKKIVNEEIGELGIMSNVFGLHLMENGYNSAKYSKEEVIEKLLSEQYEDGGWALNTTVGVSDVDITAMTVQCLAPYYKENARVKSAVDGALALLSAKQRNNGGFSSYYSDENPESAAQVIVALTSLGINPLTDARFIKNENSAVDFMLTFKAPDHGFTHKQGGSYNVSATTQALYSLVSIYRLQHGMGRLYELNAGLKTVIAEETSTPVTTQAAPVKPVTPAVAPAGPAVPKTTQAASSRRQTQPAAKTTQAVSRTKREIKTRTFTSAASAPETGAKTEKTAATAKQTVTTQAKSTVAAEKKAANAQTTATTVQGKKETEELTSVLVTKKNETLPETSRRISAQPETTRSVAKKEESRISLKAGCVAAVWLLALVSAVILLAKGNRKIINFIIIAVLAGAVTAGVSISDIQRPDEYYTVEETTSVTNSVTVTMSIDCKTVAGRGDEKITPSDGIILEKTEFTLPQGSTAYDCLIYAAKKYKIPIEDSSKTLTDHRSAYIAGINYLFEFDYGEMSGWMFSVNGSFGDVGCGEYTLSEGDSIEWRYTTNIGEDL